MELLDHMPILISNELLHLLPFYFPNSVQGLVGVVFDNHDPNDHVNDIH